MFTEQEYAIVDHCQELICRFGILATDWDPVSKKLVHSSSKRKKAAGAGYFAICVVAVFHTGNGLRNLMLAVRGEGKGESDEEGGILRYGFQFVYTFTFPAWILALTLCLHFWTNREKTVTAINQVTSFGRRKGLASSATKRAKYFRYFYKVYWTTVYLAIVVVIGAELSVLLPATGYSRWVVLVVPSFYLSYMITTGSFLAFYQVIVYFFLAICHEELAPPRAHKQAGTGIEVFQEGLRRYRGLSLLSSLFNGTVCKGFVPAAKYIFCLDGMIMLALSVRIRPDGPIELYMKMVMLAIAIYAWAAAVIAGSMMSSVWSLGKAFLEKFANCVRASKEIGSEYKTFVLKEIKSLRPVRISVGGLYDMEREAKLTLMNFIVVGTVNVLLLLESK